MKEFKCDFCNKKFTAKRNLQYHNSICKIKLKKEEEMKQEIKKNRPKFECIYCKKQLASKQNTINHQNICKNKIKKDNVTITFRELIIRNSSIEKSF